MAEPNRLKTVFIIGAIAVFVACVAFWAAVASPSTTQAVAFIFFLIALIVATFSLCVVEGNLIGSNSKQFRLGTYSATGFYLLASSVTALFYILFAPEKFGFLIALEVAFIGGFVALELIFLAAGRKSRQDDAQAGLRREGLNDLGARLGAILERFPNSPEREKLARLIEDIRFFNPGANVGEDADISEKIDALDKAAPEGLSEPSAAAISAINDLVNLAKRRSLASQAAKRGGF
ncbi:MAG: hypothetical protein LBS60_11095 [Deltaproteobacteria bacterium]|jgi:hypothetical protein|nr:hypothetical protein [Deltaproteobacteria bacterium]